MTAMTRPITKPAAERVSARVVAAYLGVKDTTVYSLCRGVRGWRVIEVLPHIADPNTARRNRFTFDINAVADWVERTGFKVKPQGRRRRRVVETQAVA